MTSPKSCFGTISPRSREYYRTIESSYQTDYTGRRSQKPRYPSTYQSAFPTVLWVKYSAYAPYCNFLGNYQLPCYPSTSSNRSYFRGANFHRYTGHLHALGRPFWCSLYGRTSQSTRNSIQRNWNDPDANSCFYTTRRRVRAGYLP